MTITFLVSVTGHMVGYVTCNWSSLALLTTVFNYPFHTPPTPAITLTVLVLYLEGWHTQTFLKELISLSLFLDWVVVLPYLSLTTGHDNARRHPKETPALYIPYFPHITFLLLLWGSSPISPW